MNPEFIAFSILILLFSVIVHEVMHGYVALRFGDHTAEHMGRLTLNPIPHIDPFGTILLPLMSFFLSPGFFIGWAKPVPVNPLNFSNIKKGELAVSAAGIGANLVLATVASIIYRILNIFYPQGLLLEVLLLTVNINLLLAVFNLIPLPPLDGSKILMTLLPYSLARKYLELERYGLFILLILLIIPIGGHSIISWIIDVGTGLLRLLLLGGVNPNF